MSNSELDSSFKILQVWCSAKKISYEDKNAKQKAWITQKLLKPVTNILQNLTWSMAVKPSIQNIAMTDNG